ncbi:MAG TPA: 2OG-Fe(II) oxygenase [Polyangia bacterium]|nr:2OG-Fe(II) oxygenase [Polyangia bacterium]
MTAVVRFQPELADWLTQGLDAGKAPAALIQKMIDEQMQPAVAHALVEAFVGARRAGAATPRDTLVVEEGAGLFLREAPLIAAGATLPTSDGPVRVLARATSPTLALLGAVMSRQECAQLVALARPRLVPSTVVDPQTGQDVVAGYRNSRGMFFRLGESDLIRRLDRRFAELMRLPVENGEGLQVLCYGPGGATAPHFDFVAPSNAANQASVARSGQRISTLLVYLTDVEEGGETVFPRAGWSVHPHAGNAIYFESSNRQGQLDPQSLHAGQPVRRGEKWVVTKWMRQRRFIPRA